jgi:hypothetical protein
MSPPSRPARKSHSSPENHRAPSSRGMPPFLVSSRKSLIAKDRQTVMQTSLCGFACGLRHIVDLSHPRPHRSIQSVQAAASAFMRLFSVALELRPRRMKTLVSKARRDASHAQRLPHGFR